MFQLYYLKQRESSCRCIFLNTRKLEQRHQVINFGNDDVAAGFCSNIIERYQKRPLEHPDYNFDDMCLMDFAMLFQPHYKKKKDQVVDDNGDEDAYQQLPAPTTSRLLMLQDNSKMKIRNV